MYTVEEHHVAVHAGRDNQTLVKDDRPKDLLRNSILTPSLAASIMNAKYINGLPLYRISQEFLRNDIHISRQAMANWMIQCADRYLGFLYDYLHKESYRFRVLQADETPVMASKDGRPANSKSYMWIYQNTPIILYEYQRARKANHPREFLKGFAGMVLCDGYSTYRKLDPKAAQKTAKDTVAYETLKRIGAIYHLDNQLSDLKPDERKKQRQMTVKPLAEAFFA